MATLFGTKPRPNTTAANAALQSAGKPRLSQEETQKAIKQRAEEIYRQRNGSPGDPLSDWLKAESEIKRKLDA